MSDSPAIDVEKAVEIVRELAEWNGQESLAVHLNLIVRAQALVIPPDADAELRKAVRAYVEECTDGRPFSAGFERHRYNYMLRVLHSAEAEAARGRNT